METSLSLKPAHMTNFLNGTVYLINKSYDLIYYFSSLFQQPSESERVDKGLDNLYSVREEVTSREETLRHNVHSYLLRAKEFMKKNMKREAKIMIKLYMLYDIQVTHCQTTLTAIESHIISLESVSLNKKVCTALKHSNYVNGFENIDENILEDAVEKLDDRNLSTNEFLRTLGDIPSLDIDDTMIETELKKLESETVSTPSSNLVETINFPEVPTGALFKEEKISQVPMSAS